MSACKLSIYGKHNSENDNNIQILTSPVALYRIKIKLKVRKNLGSKGRESKQYARCQGEENQFSNALLVPHGYKQSHKISKQSVSVENLVPHITKKPKTSIPPGCGEE